MGDQIADIMPALGTHSPMTPDQLSHMFPGVPLDLFRPHRWRDDVVRSGERVFVASDGRRFEKSLDPTCLGCHENKAAHCDRCHGYLDVSPYCWDCHVDPKGGH